jgi:hypothetical protein
MDNAMMTNTVGQQSMSLPRRRTRRNWDRSEWFRRWLEMVRVHETPRVMEIKASAQ